MYENKYKIKNCLVFITFQFKSDENIIDSLHSKTYLKN